MQSRTLAQPMIEVIMSRKGILYDVLLILGGSLLPALSAQIAIPLPFSPVPITGQTFAVLLVGTLLGSRRGALAMLAYLGEGLLGLPVFAGGRGGLAVFMGPTAGYLWGFVAAAFLVGSLAERGWDRHIWSAGAAMFLGNGVIYLFGLPWLSYFLPGSLSQVLALGLYPFIPGDILKLALAALALPSGWALLQRRKG
ncbi:biotin transport system substrate-specific component [Candidatus Hakubella thermalkaliphila]|uniref:Biotin transporter n=1 Tax=Candidatus Hakubella thermalkaliphila TaxID=2754717 RepID=A0A6V8PSP6_9ACTN|nr:biotin transporter BioY [Candidatus Hakubella thermalkaliphila]GFP35213.1 biotin transport system substrate-specific component [Candidatus Hakubella thermalkaliphila]